MAQTKIYVLRNEPVKEPPVNEPESSMCNCSFHYNVFFSLIKLKTVGYSLKP